MKYIANGTCIYCPNPSDSEEHVLPLGMNGNYILKLASCSECRKVTGAFERALMRGSFAHVRVGHGFKTRRPKQRPKTFPLFLTKNGREVPIDAAVSDHPLVLPLPLFPLPKLVFGGRDNPELKPLGLVIFHLNELEPVLKANDAESVAVVEELQFREIGRLLAKMAYGFLVGELGRERVKGHFLLPIIRGDLSKAGLYIGSSPTVLKMQPDDPAVKYESRGLPREMGGGDIAIVTIRLFPHMTENPAYVVLCDLAN